MRLLRSLFLIALLAMSATAQISYIQGTDLVSGTYTKINNNFSYLDSKGTGAPTGTCNAANLGQRYFRLDAGATFASVYYCANIAPSVYGWDGPYGAGSGGGGMANPMTTLGDLIIGNAGGIPQRLGMGGNGTMLSVNGGVLGYNSIPTLLGFTPAPATSGTALLKGNGAGGTTSAIPGTDYVQSLPATDVQTNQSNAYTTGTQDFTSALHLIAKNGVAGAIPATCTLGEVYFATDSTPGQNWWFCTSANHWTQQLNSGGGGTGVSGPPPVTFSFDTSTNSCSASGGTGAPTCTSSYNAGTGHSSVVVNHGLSTSTPIPVVYISNVLALAGVTSNSTSQITYDFIGNQAGSGLVSSGFGGTGGGGGGTVSYAYHAYTGTSALDLGTYNSVVVTASGANPTVTISANPATAGAPVHLNLCNDTSIRTWTLPLTFKLVGVPIFTSECVATDVSWDGTNYNGLGSTSTPSVIEFGGLRTAPTQSQCANGGCGWTDATDGDFEYFVAGGPSAPFKMFLSGADCNPVTGICTKTNGTPITGTIASGSSLALGTSAIASNACTTVVTATATGALTTDVITWSPSGDWSGITGYSGTTGTVTVYPYATANTANFKVCNWTASSITPGAASINWRVSR